MYNRRGSVYGEERTSSIHSRVQKKAVNLVIEKGVPVWKVARDLDIHPNLVYQWRRMFMAEGDGAFVGTGKLKPEDAELRDWDIRAGTV